MCENIGGALETDLLKRKGAAQRKCRQKVLVIDEILEDKHANCYIRLVITCLEK